MAVPRRPTAAFAVALLLPGCVGELRELPGAPALVDGGPDAGGPDRGVTPPPDAQTVVVPDAAPDLASAPTLTFASAISHDLDLLGCTAAAPCHGGAEPMHLIPMPASMIELMANYAAVKPRAEAGAGSLLLQKPLKDSMLSHVGGQVFDSTMNPVYRRWLDWIQAGAPAGIGDPDGGS